MVRNHGMVRASSGAVDWMMHDAARNRVFEEYQGGYILPEAKEPYLDHAYNNIMHMLVECGIIGVLALLIFWLTWFSYGVASWRKCEVLQHWYF